MCLEVERIKTKNILDKYLIEINKSNIIINNNVELSKNNVWNNCIFNEYFFDFFGYFIFKYIINYSPLIMIFYLIIFNLFLQ